MISKWYCLIVSVVLTTCGLSYLTAASPCEDNHEFLTVGHTPKRIFSPGYPDHYDNNLHCVWVFETFTNQRSGFGIQLTTLELELDAPYALKTGKCNDSLEVYEGTPPNLGQSLGKWCGKKKHIIKTMSENVTLVFHTSEYYVGKGFVIEYSLVTVASAECRPGKVTPVHVGPSPLYESFDVKIAEERWLSFPHTDRCTWTMEAIDEFGNSDPNSALVIEAFNVPNVLCEVGHFIIYDGQDTSSRKVLEWCDRGQAFSKIYLSTNYATMTFFFKQDKKLTSKIEPIELKLYTRNITYSCIDTKLPSINVGTSPVYFPLPFSKSLSGAMCDVHVSQHVRNTVHIEVISVSEQAITCETDAIVVTRASGVGEVKKLCNRNHYPMYLPHTHDLIVGVKNASSRVIVRALSDDIYCGGEDIEIQAYDDMIIEQMLPRYNKDIAAVPHNCYHRQVITTSNANRTIALDVRWTPNLNQSSIFTETDTCDTDFISVYDGLNESAPLLFSSCRKLDMPNNNVTSKIIGTQENMLIIFNTDGANEVQPAVIQYYSLPANIMECKKEHEIFVNRSLQILTSPNYPEFYPLDITCTYVMTAVIGHVIVVQAVDTKFAAGCGDILNIYDGISWRPENTFGHICGYDKTNRKFVSKANKAAIRFRSDKFGSLGGWKLKVYSRRRGSGADKANLSLILISLVLFLGSRLID